MMAQRLLHDGNVSLFRGQFDEAIQCFRRSILLSSQDLLSDSIPPENDRDDDAPSNNNANSAATRQPVIQSVGLDLAQILTSTETISSHNVFDLFDRAFVALPNASPATSSIVCIYNIGLTHHTQAMLHPRDSTYHFQRARHFYHLANKALEEVPHPLESLILVQLAILNNMAHISCHFWDKPGTQVALQAILEILPNFLSRSVILAGPDVLFFYSYRGRQHVPTMNHAPTA